MKIAVGIATAGRPDILSETLAHLALQGRRADDIVVCPAQPEDIDRGRLDALPGPIRCVSAPRGLCAQRNAILDAVPDADLVVFFDDDYLPSTSFLMEAERLFTENPAIVVATGEVLADGIHGPGLTVHEGLAILARDRPEPRRRITPVRNAYGCNMLLRMAAIRKAGARFDENLPLYGWQEDADFSGQLAGQGEIVQATALRGVHLGNKRGRSPGLRLGYSQIANPHYLVCKGTMKARRALRLALGNLAANLLGSLRPVGLFDRRGRLKGNALALMDLLRGRLAPQRILSLS